MFNSSVAIKNQNVIEKDRVSWTELLRFYLNTKYSFYRPKVEILIDGQKYLLKTATDKNELLKAFMLRAEVFLDKKAIENDYFDQFCDHLIIVDKKNGNVVGTYRLLHSDDSIQSELGHYSESEFNIDFFKKLPGKKLELGRAAIAPDHRNGLLIDILWKGIAKYVEKRTSDYLFGLSSLMSENIADALSLTNYLEHEQKIMDINLSVKDVYNSQNYFNKPKFICLNGEKLLPPLLRTYLSAGAKVSSTFAYDKNFKCFDFFTVIKTDELSPLFKKDILNIYNEMMTLLKFLTFLSLAVIYFIFMPILYLLTHSCYFKGRIIYLKFVSIFANLTSKILGLHVEVKNPYEINFNKSYFIVSNHLSYLDVLALYKIFPCSFVTSKEIKNTPFLGQICLLGGCLFVDRKSKENRSHELKEINDSIDAQISVLVFPEATSSDGKNVLNFKAGLFASVIESKVPTLPVTLNYKMCAGQKYQFKNKNFVFWYGDMTFLPHFWNALKQKNIFLEMTIHSPIDTKHVQDFKELANCAHSVVNSSYLPITI